MHNSPYLLLVFLPSISLLVGIIPNEGQKAISMSNCSLKRFPSCRQFCPDAQLCGVRELCVFCLIGHGKALLQKNTGPKPDVKDSIGVKKSHTGGRLAPTWPDRSACCCRTCWGKRRWCNRRGSPGRVVVGVAVEADVLRRAKLAPEHGSAVAGGERAGEGRHLAAGVV